MSTHENNHDEPRTTRIVPGDLCLMKSWATVSERYNPNAWPLEGGCWMAGSEVAIAASVVRHRWCRMGSVTQVVFFLTPVGMGWAFEGDAQGGTEEP